MPHGPIVTDQVELLIASVYKKNPKWTAKVLQLEVNYLLTQQDPKTPEGWPGLSAVQKALTRIRKQMNAPAPQEKPWSMSVLDSYPMSPQGIAAALKVWKLRLEQGRTFTVREAKWTERLCGVLENVPDLAAKAIVYARVELMYEIIGLPFDSTDTDRLLNGLPTISQTFEYVLPTLTQAAYEKTDDKGNTVIIEDGVDIVRQLKQAGQFDAFKHEGPMQGAVDQIQASKLPKKTRKGGRQS